MRIVIDATAAVSGGKLYLMQLLAEFARSEMPHELIIFHLDDDELATLELRQRFQFRRVVLLGAGNVQRLTVSVSKMLWRLFVLPWHLYRLQPDLLFSNAGFNPGWRPAQTRLVLALHNSLPLHERSAWDEATLAQRLRLWTLRRLIQRAARTCDALIVFSEHLRQRVRESCGLMKHPPAVIYYGIDWSAAERVPDSIEAELMRYGLRAPYLLYVSHWHHYKNVPRLLEAFAMLRKQHPKLTLVLAGEVVDHRYWRKVTAKIAQLGLADAVRHLSGCTREDLKIVYRGALAMVYPSLAENCPFGMLEAMACGLPMAAADTSAMPEIGGNAAIYFDPHDATQITAVIDRLVGNQSLRAELSRHAIARAQQFSWPLAAQETLRIFARVIETAKTKE